MLFAALAALAFLRRKVDWGTGWVWPVPNLRTPDNVLYQAVISDGAGSPRPNGQLHKGVDIMYRRRSLVDRLEYASGRKDAHGFTMGTPQHFAPDVPIVAARDGYIWSSSNTPRGWTVVIDHGKPFATYYTHMRRSEFPDIKNGAGHIEVKAGDVIGWMGGDPMEPSHLRHLHFSVAHDGIPERDAVDPAPSMKAWPRVAWEYKP